MSDSIKINLTNLGLLYIKGQDADKLLQGQFTCDIEAAKLGFLQLGAHCNPQGRIISLFQLIPYEQGYLLQLPNEMLTIASNALKKYAVFFKVEITDESDKLSRIVFAGSHAEQELLALFHTLPTHDREILLPSKSCLLIKHASPFPTYEIITPEPDRYLRELPGTERSNTSNNWKQLNITAGIPTVYPTTTSKFLPHDINLHLCDGISFTKGCYTGQEIIARMHYRGQLKKHMYRASVIATHAPQPGDDIYRETPCGTIVDSCLVTQDHSGKNTYQLLVIADKKDIAEHQLFLDPAKTESLEFLSMPYALHKA